MTPLIIQTIQERKHALGSAVADCLEKSLFTDGDKEELAKAGKSHYDRACELDLLLKFLNGEIDNEQYTFQGLRSM